MCVGGFAHGLRLVNAGVNGVTYIYGDSQYRRLTSYGKERKNVYI